MAFSKLRAVLTLDDKASAGLKGFGRVLSNIGQIAGGNLLASFVRDATRQLKNLAVTALDVGASFEQGMSNVGAVSGAAGVQMAALTKQAREMGKSTVFSAVEASSAMESFAKAGFSVNEIMKATGPTLELAAAGQLSMGQAASITANAIRAFGLEAGDAQDVSDLLAKSASSANLTVSDMGGAFSFAASAASTLGIDMTETATAVALLANNGIPATRAGRGLATALRELVTGVDEAGNATKGLGIEFKKQADGTFSLIDAMRQMEAAGVTSEDALRNLSSMSGRVFAVLLNEGVPAIEAMDKSLRDRLGFGAEVARKRLDNLKGDTILFKSAATELGIVLFGKVRDGLRAVVQHGTNLVIRLGEMFERGIGVRGMFLLLAIGATKVAITMLGAAVGAEAFFNRMTGGIGVLNSFILMFPKTAAMIDAVAGKMFDYAASVETGDTALGAMLDTARELLVSLETLAANPPVTPEGVELMEQMKQLLEDIQGSTTTLAEANVKNIDGIRELIEDGVSGALDLISVMENGTRKQIKNYETVGKTINRSLRGIGVAAATDFGDALVDAAFTGNFAFKDFMRNLLRDIARAIIQALILKAILGITTGGAGAVAPMQGPTLTGAPLGSRGMIAMANGGFNRTRDSMPAILSPGEAVLPVELTDFLLEAAAGAGGRRGGEVIEVEVNSDIPMLVQSINRRVRNRSVSLESSKLVAQRGNV